MVKESEDVETPEARTWSAEREFGLASVILRSKVEGSDAVEVQLMVMGCVGSTFVPGKGERIERA